MAEHCSQNTIVFGTQSYLDWAGRLQQLAEFELGVIERKDFLDGEHYLRVHTPVDDRDVLIVSGTVSDLETMELFDLANAIVDGGALRLKIVLPYFGYSTMEREVKRGEAVKAKYRARLLSNGLPRASMGNRFYMLDLHAEGLPQYFENGVQTKHVYAKPIVMRIAKELSEKYGNSLVLASADAGRMKWVESLARDLGVAPAFAYKERIDGASTVSLGISGQVKGKFVVVYDDMIRTGSSLMNAAAAYLDAGAAGVAAVATHALFPGNSLEEIRKSGLFKEIVVTDSHPRARKLENDFLKVVSCVELFLPQIQGLGDDSSLLKEFERAKA